ncbi:MAG: DUF975 family protein [Clostridia bacterium]|nr:DUF975 family protein [Clostridia bacterium]
MTDKAIRKTSRQLNQGTYLKSISIVAFTFFCSALLTIIPFSAIKLADYTELREKTFSISPLLFPAVFIFLMILLCLAQFILLSTASIGEKAWYSGRLTRKQQCGKRLRFWFKPSRSFKAFRLSSLIFLLKLIWTVVLLSPAILMFVSVVLISFYGGIELYLFISLTAGGTIFLLIGLAFRFIIIQRYFLAPYLMADNPKLRVVQAVKQSKNLSEGQLFRIVKFKLKYTPVFFTYLLVFPAIFFHPNYKQGCSVIAKELYL